MVIETTGALIQGMWGSGKQDFGVLHVLTERRELSLRPEMITVSHRGVVLCGGRSADAETLQKAEASKVRGLIVGSLDPDLVGLVRGLSYPVIVTEGFGDAPMAAPIFTLLQTNAGRETAVDAMPADRWEGRRPEIVIPLPATSQSPPSPAEGEPLGPNKRVRVLRAPYAGVTGVVQAVLEERAILANGLRAQAARVELEEIGPIVAPVANLEIIE